MIFPHLDTDGVRLAATGTRRGGAVRDELAGHGLDGLPGRDVFAALWPGRYDQVGAQFLLHAPGSGRVAGYASVHGFNSQARHGCGSLVADERELGPDGATDAYALTVNYAFSMWNLRKLYLWTLDEDLAALRRTGAEVRLEGSLPEYVLDGAELRTAHVFAVYREAWERTGAEFVRVRTGEGLPA
ncbi:GNAT family protein [Nocardiopsis tropica]|uniref:GNAT family protein n=1 Tax=Nocardiopsis tropica TaxID=109330 RepID=A0ABU7L046_9ACTN|nr:GNAT family protein [Nocardiopsis umidischolae]MEE2054930.1 GNAT family protein [Nocardiopsis umidischolae]